MSELFTLKERTCLDASGKVVPCGSPQHASLLGPEGWAIPMAQAEALGLVGVKLADAPEDKMLRKAEDKAPKKRGRPKRK